MTSKSEIQLKPHYFLPLHVDGRWTHFLHPCAADRSHLIC